jgi:hypothetical protein
MKEILSARSMQLFIVIVLLATLLFTGEGV